jgi:hypothetical protein
LPAGAERQPWADGFESRWDSRMERGKTSVLFELLEEGIINFKDFFAAKPQLL